MSYDYLIVGSGLFGATNEANHQGNAVVNCTEASVPYTRIIEHKHFESFGQAVYHNPKTVISREYSTEWKPGMDPITLSTTRKTTGWLKLTANWPHRKSMSSSAAGWPNTNTTTWHRSSRR